MKTIGTAEEVDGLYQFQDFASLSTKHSVSSCSVMSNSTIVTPQTLWHFRLGHPSHPRIKNFQAIDSSIVSTSMNCDICHFSKQKKLSFPVSSSISSCCFDLIHMDI